MSFAIDHLDLIGCHTKWIAIVDNDVLFKPEAKRLFSLLDGQYDAIGQIGHRMIKADRLFPFFCIVNRNKMMSQKIKYFDPERLNVNGKGKKYETGSSFTEDILQNHWNIKLIEFNKHIVHGSGVTLKNKNPYVWLKKNQKLHGLEVRNI